MKRLIWPLFLPLIAHANFTLNNSVGAHFKDNEVKVRVTSISGNCNATGITGAEIYGLIGDAIDDFWNTVPTSRLKLKKGGMLETSDNDFLTGKLCLIGSDCDGATPIPAVSEIVITCNTSADNFPGGSSLLALTMPTVLKGSAIKGAVIAINATNGSFANLSHSKKVAVIAHEIGHAIGLGHDPENANLMYYSVVKFRKKLGQGDINGVTYLYPTQIDAFGLNCITGTTQAPPPPGWWPTLGLGVVGGLLLLRPRRGQRNKSHA